MSRAGGGALGGGARGGGGRARGGARPPGGAVALVITDALLDFVAWVVETVTGWFPVIAPPSWLGDDGALAGIFSAASSMGVWLPVRLGFTVAAALVVCIVAGFAIKFGRSIASYFLAGGGSSG